MTWLSTIVINTLAAYSMLSVWQKGEVFGWLRMRVEDWVDNPEYHPWYVSNPVSRFFLKASLCKYCFCFHLAFLCALLGSSLCDPWGGFTLTALAVRTVVWWSYKTAEFLSDVTDDRDSIV